MPPKKRRLVANDSDDDNNNVTEQQESKKRLKIDDAEVIQDRSEWTAVEQVSHIREGVIWIKISEYLIGRDKINLPEVCKQWSTLFGVDYLEKIATYALCRSCFQNPLETRMVLSRGRRDSQTGRVPIVRCCGDCHQQWKAAMFKRAKRLHKNVPTRTTQYKPGRNEDGDKENVFCQWGDCLMCDRTKTDLKWCQVVRAYVCSACHWHYRCAACVMPLLVR